MEARSYRTILVESAGPIATITMNKPERKNPLGPEMVNELVIALDDAKSDESVRVIVLTGAGTAFSAGGDLKQMGGGGEALAACAVNMETTSPTDMEELISKYAFGDVTKDKKNDTK